MSDAVSILGATGELGFGLALRLGRAGVAVTIGSRSAERAAQAAERARAAVPDGTFDGLENAAAARLNDMVVLSVPFASQAETLKGLQEAMRPGQVLVDATVPLATAVGGRPARTVGVWQGSAAQQAQELAADGVGVVSALHTVSAALLTDLEHDLDEDVLVCGDRKDDKRRVAELLRRVPGLRCVDCGRLEMSRFTEQLTPLLIGVNVRHKVRAGIRLTGLPAGGSWPA
jgi:NADPH-dependent F420 reductase